MDSHKRSPNTQHAASPAKRAVLTLCPRCPMHSRHTSMCSCHPLLPSQLMQLGRTSCNTQQLHPSHRPCACGRTASHLVCAMHANKAHNHSADVHSNTAQHLGSEGDTAWQVLLLAGKAHWTCLGTNATVRPHSPAPGNHEQASGSPRQHSHMRYSTADAVPMLHQLEHSCC